MLLTRKILFVASIFICSIFSIQSNAGGITIGGTRVIYPADKKQVSMSVRNTSEKASFMVQSWVENPDGSKSKDFVVTPPIYVSGPSNENILRIMYVGPPVRKDLETLYYFNTKAIPSMDRNEINGKNILMLAATTRIKLFVRPSGLEPSIDKAFSMLTFHREGKKLRIENPTPYHITLANIKYGSHTLPDSMVNPRSNLLLLLPSSLSSTIVYRTINDYGAATPEVSANIK
jgi:P pilus assembly protein, chaperone PapD